MKRRPTYPEALARDRDKYLRQRNRAINALVEILPLAEGYLKGAPSHPDNAKLEEARAVLRDSE